MTTQVKTGVIADGAVTTSKISDGAITSAKIADGTIVGDDIANTTIEVGKLSATGTPSASTFLRGDGAWQAPAASGVTSITAGTGLSGGTITTTGTIALVTTAGAVGTYGLFRYAATVNPGGTVAGSNLKWASAKGYISAAASPSGTWQCMGYSNDNCSTDDQYVTLYVRIA